MIILASSSPRRKELLKKIVNNFKVVPSDFDESIPDSINCMDLAEYFAVQKVKSVSKDYKGDIVIGADTLIVYNNKIYGKPKDKTEAREMLKTFSGNMHYVITGVCVMSSTRTISFSSVNEVYFYSLSDEEIDEYLLNDEYEDKAGSYAIQGKASLFIKKINGEYNSIVGLPIAELNRILKNFF